MRVRCRALGFYFEWEGQRVVALRNLTFESKEGEFLSIIGPSGCGKTTLLRAVAGLLQPSEGVIERINGHENSPGRALLVYQEDSLFPWMTVLENAAYGLKTQGFAKAEQESRAHELLRRFGLAGREDSYPHTLSVGMKQRVAVIRCFLSDPAMLLMDEPFAALDAQTRLTLQQELLGLWEPGRRSVLFVTHDVEEALLLSDRILVLSQSPGCVIDQIQVPFARPRTPATALTSDFLALKRRIYDALGIEQAVARV